VVHEHLEDLGSIFLEGLGCLLALVRLDFLFDPVDRDNTVLEDLENL